ncbi:BREX system P-loop protein BrxC [Anaerotardibacter muris]|uniref:BREX system P-loop protein BrxC n=1 Tax=Anaerotardibacter muris TaxID=2941505 RepID=UPI00203E0295|nr:BREX system P-loop protein BrxC [Anaerotardibacter muris]
MKIQDIFSKDINRSINGVIKVAQDDDALIQQELSEYVVTKELSRHFADFFENYDRALDVPTDKMGVWITGFFGSGKSHFLKMLSYLLSNKTVGGNAAIDYFDGKIEDPMVYAKVKRAASVPTEAILFNIDSKAGQWKEGDTAKTALLRGFARVFYEHQGFYGLDFKLARLEAFVDSKGKTEEFREAFSRINGGNWIEDRESYTFYEDDIVEVLGEVLGMSEESARRFFDNTNDEAIAPDKLAEEIKAYVDRKSEENGGNFRLLFCVDEVGQFIGDDTNLMLNLQTLTEELGAKCEGKVWIMVTSQEALDKVIKVEGDDFSKIQGRFNTRLTLSSSSVDEVIKKRILDKTPEANIVLQDEFEKSSSVLKNLFAFEDSQSDLIGYASVQDFQESYPFVGYQFKLLPKVFSEIRRHGNAGKHLASGERSMLSGFQESAQRVENEDSKALVPFWSFYDTLAKSLDHEIRQVIDRATTASESNQGLQPQDIEVLKTLYLIHYIKDVSPTLGNITILMVDNIDADKIAIRNSVKESLDRLVRENYVARHGDTYAFLTDEEQDVEREIKSTSIDSALVIDQIKKIIFDGIYPSKKYSLGTNAFVFDAYVDDSLHGQAQNGMKLDIVTNANQLAKASEAELALKSTDKALMVLRTNEDYYEVLANAARINKYVKTQNIAQLPDTKQNIIRSKQKEAASAAKEAQAILDSALANADVFIDGQAVQLRGARATEKIDQVLKELTGVVYTKADYVGASVEGAADIKQILLGTYQEPLAGANDRALDEIGKLLDANEYTHQATSLGDIQRIYQQQPFGWKEADISALLATLLMSKAAQLEEGGVVIQPTDPRALTALTNRKEWDKVQIRKRTGVSEELLSPARRLLKEFTGQNIVTEDEDDFIQAVINALENAQQETTELLKTEYTKRDYPGRTAVVEGQGLTTRILENKADPQALLRAFNAAKDELLDFAEDFEPIQGFFPNQQQIFDEASDLLATMEVERAYLSAHESALDALDQIANVVAMDSPFRLIPSLREHINNASAAHQGELQTKKNDLLDHIASTQEAIETHASNRKTENSATAVGAVVSKSNDTLTKKREQVNAAATIVETEALRNQINAHRDNTIEAIDEAVESANRPPKPVIPQEKPGSSTVATPPTPSAPPAPKTKVLQRADVCPATKLSTPDQVDAYVEAIKEKLLAAIDECGSVRLKG